jgi:hypothetical protein
MQNLLSLPRITHDISVNSLRLEVAVDIIRTEQGRLDISEDIINPLLEEYRDEFVSRYTTLTETIEILGKMFIEYKGVLANKGMLTPPRLSLESPTYEHYMLKQIQTVGKQVEDFLLQGLADINKIMERDDPEVLSLAFLWKFAFQDSLNAISHINKDFSSLDFRWIWRRKGKKYFDSKLGDYYYLYVPMVPVFMKIMDHILLLDEGKPVDEERRGLFVKQVSLLSSLIYGNESTSYEEEPEEMDTDSIIAHFQREG